MKIEKINENQLKIILNRNDLSERDIDLIEIVNGSDKTHNLVREMMEQALLEHDFQASNSPLVIEAAPLSRDSVMLIVTKVEENSFDSDIDKGLNLLSELAKLSSAKKRSFSQPGKKAIKKPEEIRTVFSFNTLDSVMDASARLYNTFWGDSFLTKDRNKYYLMLTNNQNFERMPLRNINAILSEYGEKILLSSLSEEYLKEHGEVIIKEQATIKLAEYLYN